MLLKGMRFEAREEIIANKKLKLYSIPKEDSRHASRDGKNTGKLSSLPMMYFEGLSIMLKSHNLNTLPV